jgi:hypothetical protein
MRSGDIEEGDMVFSIQDQKNGFVVPGLVLACKRDLCLIVWGSENQPMGWWKKHLVEKINESR